MQKILTGLSAVLLAAVLATPVLPALAQSENPPPATITNDEGGPVIIDGEMNYTNPLITLGVAEPLIVLEDQAGFVDRNRGYIMTPQSQVLGVITSDFFEPPFKWTLSLPQEPQGALRDVDNDGQEDKGVQTFAVAYWTNIFGDPYLEKRDLQGGGWSTAYATTRVKGTPSGKGEVTGGTYVVWAPDDQQGFPSGFGEDGKLFTEDDPIVTLPAGYTIVNMDTDPFTFDRSAHPELSLVEPEEVALDDFSNLSYTEAFDKMIEKMRKEYAFTDYKHIDWDALSAEFRPRMEAADKNRDSDEYRRALFDFTLSFPDGHVGMALIREDFERATGGGLGLAMRELDDGNVIVNFITPEGPAELAGIEVGAQILEMGGMPVEDYVAKAKPFRTSSSETNMHLQQLRYATRAPIGTEIEVTYQNPGASEPQTAQLTFVDEPDSFRFSSLNRGLTGAEQPVEFRLLDNGLAYAKIYSFSDNELLTVQLWERLMQTLNSLGVQGLIIDMRQNSGGNGFLADQMAAYFFNDELELGQTGFYDESLGKFYFDDRLIDRFYPPDDSLRYKGRVAVITGPNCASACEFFTYDMTRQGRADVIGNYPTGGMGGSIGVFRMPDLQQLQFTVGRAVDMDGNIHIEGKGVPPTVRVPVTEETLFYDGDILLDTTNAVLLDEDLPYTVEAGADSQATPVAAVTPASDASAVATAETTATAEATPEVAATAEVTATVEATVTETATAEPAATAEVTATVEATATPEAVATEAAVAAAVEVTATEVVAADATSDVTPTVAADVAVAATDVTTDTAATEPAETTVRIMVRSPRILAYAGPSITSAMVGSIANGTEWQVLETSPDKLWVRVNYPDANTGAWIAASAVVGMK